MCGSMTKDLFNILEDEIPKQQPSVLPLDGIIAGDGEYIRFDKPVDPEGVVCPRCEVKIDMHFREKNVHDGSFEKFGICHSSRCLSSRFEKMKAPNFGSSEPISNLKWREFCKLNNIGDEFHTMDYDNLHKSTWGKYTKKQVDSFMLAPYGVHWLCGLFGSGKTYDAMSYCEKFIRENPSCIFIKEYQLSRKWLQSREENRELHFIENLEKKSLLVIDDVGHGGGTPGFMKLLRDVIDQRLQWKEKGTVITTNFVEQEAKKVFDPSLYDRLATGRIVRYTNKSRRRGK